MWRRRLTVLIIVVLISAAGWRLVSARKAATHPADAAGVLRVSWVGRDSGSTVLPVELNWCPADRTARLWAISPQDTGVVIVFYEPDTLHLVSHQVIPPYIPVPPPMSATIAATWARETDSTVVGYAAERGTLELKGTSPQSVSGSFAVTLRRPSSPDSIRLTGSFSGVPTVTKTAGCP